MVTFMKNHLYRMIPKPLFHHQVNIVEVHLAKDPPVQPTLIHAVTPEEAFVAVGRDMGKLDRVSTFRVVDGLADKQKFSLQSLVAPDWYLTSLPVKTGSGGHLSIRRTQNTEEFKKNATFNFVPAVTGDSYPWMSIESYAHPRHYLNFAVTQDLSIFRGIGDFSPSEGDRAVLHLEEVGLPIGDVDYCLVKSWEEEDPQGIAFADLRQRKDDSGNAYWAFVSSQYKISRCSWPSFGRNASIDFEGLNRAMSKTEDAGTIVFGPGFGMFDSDSVVNRVYNHIGPLSYHKGLLFTPVEYFGQRESPLVLAFDENLQLVAYARIPTKDGNNSAAWLAVNPENELLYLPFPGDPTWVRAFSLEEFYGKAQTPAKRVNLKPTDVFFYFRDGSGKPYRVSGGIQGAVFTPTGRLYVAHCRKNDDYHNFISVFDSRTGKLLRAFPEKDFGGTDDEIEGLSYHPNGGLYLAVADNDWELIDTDDFDIYEIKYRDPTCPI